MQPEKELDFVPKKIEFIEARCIKCMNYEKCPDWWVCETVMNDWFKVMENDICNGNSTKKIRA